MAGAQKTPQELMAKLGADSIVHGHLCAECVTRYDDRCVTPHINSVCPTCRYGNSRSLWRDTGSPQECCIKGPLRKMTLKESVAANLAGSTFWWECSTCKRKHPFDPKGMSRK